MCTGDRACPGRATWNSTRILALCWLWSQQLIRDSLAKDKKIICLVTCEEQLRENWVIPCQITQKKEKMKPHLFRFCLNLECGIIRHGDADISIFGLIGQAVSEIWPI